MKKDRLDQYINDLLRADNIFTAREALSGLISELEKFGCLLPEMTEYVTAQLRAECGPLFNRIVPFSNPRADPNGGIGVIGNNACVVLKGAPAIKKYLWSVLADPVKGEPTIENYKILLQFFLNVVPVDYEAAPLEMPDICRFLSIVDEKTGLLRFLHYGRFEPYYISVFTRNSVLVSSSAGLEFVPATQLSGFPYSGKDLFFFDSSEPEDTCAELLAILTMAVIEKKLRTGTGIRFPGWLKEFLSIVYKDFMVLPELNQLALLEYVVNYGFVLLCGEALEEAEGFYMPNHDAIFGNEEEAMALAYAFTCIPPKTALGVRIEQLPLPVIIKKAINEQRRW